MKAILQESGIALVEIVVSMVLLGMIFTGLMRLYLATMESNVRRNDRRVAITLAQEEIEEFHAQTYNQVEALAGTSVTVTNAASLNNYNNVRRISNWDYVNDNDFTVVSGAATDSVRLLVTVSSTDPTLKNQFQPVTLQAVRTDWE
ncbi:MAG: hypothetical protein ACE5GM_05215 [bacterium]